MSWSWSSSLDGSDAEESSLESSGAFVTAVCEPSLLVGGLEDEGAADSGAGGGRVRSSRRRSKQQQRSERRRSERQRSERRRRRRKCSSQAEAKAEPGTPGTPGSRRRRKRKSRSARAAVAKLNSSNSNSSSNSSSNSNSSSSSSSEAAAAAEEEAAVAAAMAAWDPLEGMDAEQLAAFGELKALVAELAPQADPPVDLSAPRVVAFLDDATYCRYLRARSYNASKAAKMLVATLVWRAEYRPEDLTLEDVMDELTNEGKMYISTAVDKEGRPIIYQKPGLDNTTDRHPKVAYLVYTVEKALASIRTPGVETLTIVSDFTGYKQLTGMRNIRISKDVASILQNHYPERLGRVYMYNNPWAWSFFWGAVKPFVDVKTREKIVFCGSKLEPMLDTIAAENLEVDYGGTFEYTYDRDTYAKWVDTFPLDVAPEQHRPWCWPPPDKA